MPQRILTTETGDILISEDGRVLVTDDLTAARPATRTTKDSWDRDEWGRLVPGACARVLSSNR